MSLENKFVLNYIKSCLCCDLTDHQNAPLNRKSVHSKSLDTVKGRLMPSLKFRQKRTASLSHLRQLVKREGPHQLLGRIELRNTDLKDPAPELGRGVCLIPLLWPTPAFDVSQCSFNFRYSSLL